MSDYDDSRPSKRRRRSSSSASPVPKAYRKEFHSDKSHRRRPSPEDLRRRRRSQDREHRHSRRPASRDRRDRDSPERRHRSRSRERTRDTRDIRDRQSHSHRHSNESSSSQLLPQESTDRKSDRRHYQDQTRRSRSPKRLPRSYAPLPSQKDAFTATANPEAALDKPVEKQKPNFGLTGKLAAASNTIQTANQTIVLKYHEPPEARKPPAKDQWRLYVFKGDEILDTVELSEQSCWLIGRESAVADLPIEHQSCSKQHAVIQFRYLEKRNEFGDKIGKVKPYIIDLESANGTSLNEESVPAAKYVELRDKDVLKFGHSSREYVMQLPK